ncbi:alpha-galactosidase [Actinoplanes octamycinicus]|uniref:alpha-galactosidase n=1 Tax=Actinoplanes octamycinicus TaxID=135948 RepID=A0A7W7MB94_9ACTN|nr:alpha-galactosidase [Actinoplanes octamycinicus]MBB4743883.1 alpha-galactosidase [Actinoplanes octamycinicus]GIE58511.1 alpha-galactosidase [Actinoplanes octamycinicus]
MPLIEPSPDGATIALHTEHTTYALRLDHTVRPIHWGPRISAEEAAAIPAWRSPFDDTFEGPLDSAEDFPIAGGAMFTPAALSFGSEAGLTVAGHEIRGDELVVRLTGAVEVELHYRVRPSTDVIERWSVVRHTGATADAIVLDAHAAAVWCLPVRDNYRLSHVTGGWAREGALHRVVLPVAETTLISRRGVTGHATNPWVMLDDGTATEETGEVWSAALAFSGSWRITVSRTPAGRCSVLAAAGHDRTVTRLLPGEQAVSPVCAALYADGGFGAASRAWHHYQRAHVLPHAGELRPVLYNSWEATSFDVTEAGQRALAERAARLGVELFVVDDGWFGARTSDRAGLGDWFANPDRFPDGLRPLADHIRSLGMAFGLWVEPEMVNPDSELFRAHPDWTLHEPGTRVTELRHQLVLDFTRADVRDWAFRQLDRIIRETGLTFLKWDFNRAVTQARPQAAIGHAHGVYAVIDQLRKTHPGVRVEACAGGGGRVDLGILARTDQAWTSDNTDAVDRLGIQHGYTQVYSPGTMVAWVTDSPNPITGREVPLPFRFDVAMAGVLGLGGDLTRWTDEELAYAAEMIARYRAIRPIVQHGTLYRLLPPTGSLAASQYVLGGRSVLFVWRLAGTDRRVLVRPRGLEPETTYRGVSGAALMTDGLTVELPEGSGPVSAVVQLEPAR